jgi:hypothetical protein
MKISKKEHELITTILCDWFEVFGNKTKSGNWKLKAYSEELEFCEEFVYKRYEEYKDEQVR